LTSQKVCEKNAQKYIKNAVEKRAKKGERFGVRLFIFDNIKKRRLKCDVLKKKYSANSKNTQFFIFSHFLLLRKIIFRRIIFEFIH